MSENLEISLQSYLLLWGLFFVFVYIKFGKIVLSYFGIVVEFVVIAILWCCSHKEARTWSFCSVEDFSCSTDYWLEKYILVGTECQNNLILWFKDILNCQNVCNIIIFRTAYSEIPAFGDFLVWDFLDTLPATNDRCNIKYAI